MTTIDVIATARAEALFTSDLSAGDEPSKKQLTAAIRRAVRAHGGIRGCAGEVAAAHGGQPETAAARMRWARGVVERAYGPVRSPNGDDSSLRTRPLVLRPLVLRPLCAHGEATPTPSTHPRSAMGRVSAPQATNVLTPPRESRWELLLPHRLRLLRLAQRRLSNREDAEDCVQDALIRAACAAHLDETRIGPFLTTVVIHLCADHGRARSRAQRVLSRIRYPDTEPSPEEIVCDRSQAMWLNHLIDHQLSQRERDVLQAKADGLSTKQTADQLNITDKAAEATFTRARARMRRLADNFR
jgi:RNA polymerase sigma factor (sigma-70 family)